MGITIFYIGFLASLFGFINWRKFRKWKAERQNPSKQWEGKSPNDRKKSMEELEQDNLKYRGMGQIPPGM
ncbi:hypothetical protein FH966_09980 [Lentibacillus cibarius]|uniref:Uncharacterized protein n=1 Tax=Lentibacillus cibarius TaxID=2583219 RepID=A0A549YJD2_9BACI|nr:hypothetical protein [Lentibacillus cibarius]TRM11987.1 hypothetical protein FH966_09980 [Lentibacillus cibarius]